MKNMLYDEGAKTSFQAQARAFNAGLTENGLQVKGGGKSGKGMGKGSGKGKGGASFTQSGTDTEGSGISYIEESSDHDGGMLADSEAYNSAKKQRKWEEKMIKRREKKQEAE